MMSMHFSRMRFFGILLLGAVLVSSGCRSRQAGRGVGLDGDPLDPMGLGGTYPLGPRGEFGEPILDVQFDDVQFAYDSFQIAGAERRKIEAVADFMLANPGTTVLIDGHCDERGSREYNLSLGEHRALSVRAVLISLGVAGDRIHTRSFGSEQPLDPRSNEEAWARNRRGAFSLFRP
ncbi:MAG: OmpA family protein [Kiritimatiellia bacterium]